MEYKEDVEKGTRVELSLKLTEDQSSLLIVDDADDSLFARISFFDADILSRDNKLNVGHHALSQIYRSLLEQLSAKEAKVASWEEKASAFKNAYNIQEHKNEVNIVWLMTSILDIEPDEASWRYMMASELMKHPDFKDKEDVVIERIYLNKRHLGEKVS